MAGKTHKLTPIDIKMMKMSKETANQIGDMNAPRKTAKKSVKRTVKKSK